MFGNFWLRKIKEFVFFFFKNKEIKVSGKEKQKGLCLVI